MSSWGSKSITSASSPGGLPPTWTVVSVLAGDDVRVRDHEAGRRDPAAALDPEPARGAEDLDDARARVLDAASGENPSRRRRHVRFRTAHRRDRVDPRERVQQRPRGRQQLVQLLEDRRALDVLAQHRRSRRLVGHRPDDPRDPERHRGRQRRAEHAVDHPQPGHSQENAGARPETLEAAGQHRAREQRPDQAEQRRVLRVRAARQHERPEVTSEERADAEADQRQGADDEALGVAIQGKQHREGHDQPVDFCHR